MSTRAIRIVFALILVSSVAFATLPTAPAAQAQTGIEVMVAVGYVFIAPMVYYGSQFAAAEISHMVAVYLSSTSPGLVRPASPIETGEVKRLCRDLGLCGQDTAYLIIIIQEKERLDKVARALARRASDLVRSAIEEARSSRGRAWRIRITLGVDARPEASPWSPRFTYRTYGLNQCFSRWDFYPPGRFTINNWLLDLNRDGITDVVIPHSQTRVCLQ